MAIDEVPRTKPDLIGMTGTCDVHCGFESVRIFRDILLKRRLSSKGLTITADDIVSDYRSGDSLLKLVETMQEG
jgi:hypothetical protein